MKKTLLLMILATALPAYARYTYEIEQAIKNCQVEQSSMFRMRKGTPACTKLHHLQRLQQQYEIRMQVKQQQQQMQQQYQQQQEIIRQYHNNNPKPIPTQNRGYAWNPREGKYCEHDNNGYPLKCY